MKGIEEKTKEVLSRGVAEILPNKEKLARLMKQRKIRVYLGIDPTGRKLHLGHTVPLKKLQEFVGLGHEVFLVIGTGTVLAGDPSLRERVRTNISEREIKKNIKNWRAEAGKILDFSKIKIRHNGDWLLKLGLKDIIDIASNVSAIKLLQRDMFQKRLKRGDTVWTREMLYPLLQGYDSVALNIDLEIGGTDQVFNMLIGRELQQKMKKKEKFVMTLPMILGTDGRPMSKTSGNCIWISDSADQMFGKIMSIPDKLIQSYFASLTDVPLTEVKDLPPREAKAKLAWEVVAIFHGKKSAQRAEQEFNRIFKERKLPSKIPTIVLRQKELNVLDLLVKTKLAPSRSEAKRLVEQGGARINGQTQRDWKKIVKMKKGDIVRVGRRRFVKIV